MTDKATIRAEARAILRGLSPNFRANAAAIIEETIWMVPQVAAARSILLFASLPDEVPTDGIAAAARRRGVQVVYPRCLPESVEMALHAVESPEMLVSGFRDIREPRLECPIVALAEIDVVLVPGLAWDIEGHRLGRGAGYYDRLFSLPVRQPYRVGLFFEAQRMHTIPTDPWDVRLDAVVTESGMILPDGAD
jgi:5-formyltetrahydrofolate cyclo-ligase